MSCYNVGFKGVFGPLFLFKSFRVIKENWKNVWRYLESRIIKAIFIFSNKPFSLHL